MVHMCTVKAGKVKEEVWEARHRVPGRIKVKSRISKIKHLLNFSRNIPSSKERSHSCGGTQVPRAAVQEKQGKSYSHG